MRRLNVKLALWLVGITVVSVVGVYFLHGYQIGRNAEVLRVQADRARKAGNIREAYKLYDQYLHHREDREGYEAWAELSVEIAKLSDASRLEKFRPLNILEETIRRYDDLHEVRESLVDYTMAIGRFPDALEHIRFLNENGKSSPELMLKTAQCHWASREEDKTKKLLAEIIGYNLETGQFAEEPPATAKELKAFTFLAQILRLKTDGGPQADAIMQQLVAWNPESPQAHLMRGGEMLATWANPRGTDATVKEGRAKLLAAAKAEIEKAYELDPNDVDVILTKVAVARAENDFDTAQKLLDIAVEKFPKRADIYSRLSELALAQRDVKKAAAQLERGLEATGDTRGLLEQLIELQFQLNDIAAARKSWEKIRDAQAFPAEFVRYLEARLALSEGKYQEAAKEFEQVRPAIERLNATYAQRLNVFLGRCYEVLALPDKQLEVNRRLLQTYPDMIAARLGMASALQALGRFEEAEESVDLLANNAQSLPALLPSILQLALVQEASRPADQQNWETVNRIAAQLFEDKNRSPVENQLLKANLLVAQGKRDEALRILSALRKEDPKNVAVWMSMSKLLARDEKTRGRIPQLLDLAEKEVGDQVQVRVERIRAVSVAGGKDVGEKLAQLEQGIGEFKDAEQQMLFFQLGASYLQAGDYANAKRCWNEVIKKDAKNAQLRQYLFELALDNKDLEGADQVIEELGTSPYFGQSNSLYKYCVAALKLKQFLIKRDTKTTPLTQEEKELLADARKNVDDGLATREEWAPLWRLRGEVSQYEGNIEQAVSDYRRSLDLNRSGQAATATRLVQLLYLQRNFTEANEVLNTYLKGAALPEIMKNVHIDLAQKAGNSDQALAMAKKEADDNPEDAAKQLVYGQILEGAGKTDEAAAAYRKATEVGPNLYNAWELLIRRLMLDKKQPEAVTEVNNAAKTLAKEPLLMARLYQRVGELKQAEEGYKTAVADRPNSLVSLRHLIEFYLSTGQGAKSVEYIDAMIDRGVKSTERGAAEHVVWARRRKAERLASLRDYASVAAAIKLLEENAVNGKLSPDDQLGIISLLADRPEPQSRARAIRMLEALRQSRSLTAREMSILAQLYNRDGRWTDAKDLMLAAAGSGGDDPDILLILAGMLLQHDEYEDAGRFANQLEQLLARSQTPVKDSTRQSARMLRARLLVKEGKKAEAAKLVEELVARPLAQDQLLRLELAGRQLEMLELYEDAERLLDEYAAAEPRRGTLALASFKGRRGDVDRTLALLDEARKSQSLGAVLQVALEALRTHPDQATSERFAQLEKWALDGAETDSEPLKVKLLLAELYDLQGRYKDVEKMYREVLADKKATDADKAVTKNNLSFILSVVNPTRATADEALKLADESIQQLGPRSDLLDTRALAYLAQGKAKQAASDLRMAVADSPSMAKYYHLALAEKQLGNLEAARDAIAKAEELRTDHVAFTLIERKGYEKLAAELNVQIQTVKTRDNNS